MSPYYPSERTKSTAATSLAAPEAAPARAAAESELAELALLLGDVDDALAVFSKANQRFLALGRQGLAWRCEAGRVRAAAEAGEVVDLSELDRTLSYARDQGHVVLGIDVQIARGSALSGTASESAFREAIQLADRLGQVTRAGRARVSWARTGDPPLAEIRKAVDQLVSHRPWHARARWELARRTQAEPGILAQFEAMGMAGDVRRALAHGQGDLTKLMSCDLSSSEEPPLSLLGRTPAFAGGGARCDFCHPVEARSAER